MTASAERFFPPRTERTVLDFVLEDFPFPLALTYSRLQDELDRQEPVAAAWRLRDAYECLLKFSACLAVADLLQAKPDHLTDPARETLGEILELLLNSRGIVLGNWHQLLADAVRALQDLVVAGTLSRRGRVLPELVSVFFKVKKSGLLKTNELYNEIGPFIGWRNEARLRHLFYWHSLPMP
jgi:hypothetical protein